MDLLMCACPESWACGKSWKSELHISTLTVMENIVKKYIQEKKFEEPSAWLRPTTLAAEIFAVGRLNV